MEFICTYTMKLFIELNSTIILKVIKYEYLKEGLKCIISDFSKH